MTTLKNDDLNSKFSRNSVKIQSKFFQKWKMLQMSSKIKEKFDGSLLKYWGLRGAKTCKCCRSRQELSNEYLFAKFLAFLACLLACFDTPENESLQLCLIWFNFQVRGFSFHIGTPPRKPSLSLFNFRGIGSLCSSQRPHPTRAAVTTCVVCLRRRMGKWTE